MSALFTVCDNAELVLPLQLTSPAYSAVIECDPVPSVTEQDAAPLSGAVNVWLHKTVEPSLKVTVPVEVAKPGLATVTVAFSMTDCPLTEGFADDETEIVVSALFTV